MNTMILRNSQTLTARNRLHPSLFVSGASKVQAPVAATVRFSAYKLAFAGLWVFIGLVGAVDTYLTVKYRAVMPAVEENPVGKWLMRLDGQDVSLFVGCKMGGTILALGVLAGIGLHCRREFALSVIVPVALGQMTLVVYLFS
jgi:hypothetical protein